ncbi:efflux RND transporter periplasmic adaptor subunit [Sulfurimonas aquatica]|uniref:Efflux RND transporter periplasmic adaptor subunit n=1 Tax=Sulfurimonas aquatica TaxID=2672570 RepID=A0A975GBL3_9BACT|nr:efflux RND transporter periplasmic adaptor subunit [Sulfurimonas aquatica]QSZ40670.1 efflux RND transporter periplasmic adaptor subunit [Sulfurimonas aquatica]
MKIFIKYFIIAIVVGVGATLFYNKVYVVKTTYETISPTKGELEVNIRGIGNVSALNIYPITSQSAGKIIKILADDGVWVKKGELLLEMDSIDLPQQLEVAHANLLKAEYDYIASKSELKNLKVQQALLEVTYSRYKKLKERGFASESEYDKAEAEFKSAQANVVVSASRIDSAKAALIVSRKNIEAIEVKIDRLKVYSPVDGYVISRDAEVGQNVLPSSPILSIVDPKTLWVQTKIDERISSQVKVMQKATISLRSQPQKLYKGFVKRVDAMSDAVTLEREVNVAFESIPEPFYINEQAEVTISIKTLEDVLKLPLSVIVQREGELGIWLAKEGRAKFLAIEKIAQSESEIAIKNISSESKIIVPNKSKKTLKDGMKIRS